MQQEQESIFLWVLTTGARLMEAVHLSAMCTGKNFDLQVVHTALSLYSVGACLRWVPYSSCGTRMQCAVSTSSPLSMSDSANTPLAVRSPVQGVGLTMHFVLGIKRGAAAVALA